MLEALVSSRIRRALFEYILAHPSDRFYLRGLAKELGLSISPLRRELKRLERAGVLRAFQEGNMLFYTVDAGSAVFQQLKQAGQPAPAFAKDGPGPASAVLTSGPEPTEAPSRLPQPAVAQQSANVIPVGVVSASSVARAWRSPLRGPALVGVTMAGIALMLLMTGFFYLTMTNERLASAIKRAVAAKPTSVTVVAPANSSSGVMRSHRWQIVPGGFGGFSASAGEESY